MTENTRSVETISRRAEVFGGPDSLPVVEMLVGDLRFLLAEVERQRREIEGLERALKYRSPIPTTEEIEAAINDNFGS